MVNISLKMLLLLIFISKSFVNSTRLIWNCPTEQCQRKSDTFIDYQKYNIETNSKCKFRGEKIIILYENDVGIYPYIKVLSENEYELHNGGVPQNVDINEHLKKLEENINKIIPDVNFNGLGVIDIEEWRPTYDSNWSSKRVYRNESIKIVKKRKPNLDDKMAANEAKKEFDKAALEYFRRTILKCKKLRPMAQWGFYGIPTCNENAESRNWEFCFPTLSDDFIYFLKDSDVIYPAPYIVNGQNYTIKKKFVSSVIKETKRIVSEIEKMGYGKKKIFLYNKIEVDPFVENSDEIVFYDPYLLCIVYEKSFKNNIDGVIIWTTSKNMANRCLKIKKYVNGIFGPFVNLLQSLNTQKQKKHCLNKKKTQVGKCAALLRGDNFKKWCQTNFYGPLCEKKKLKLVGLKNTL